MSGRRRGSRPPGGSGDQPATPTAAELTAAQEGGTDQAGGRPDPSTLSLTAMSPFHTTATGGKASQQSSHSASTPTGGNSSRSTGVARGLLNALSPLSGCRDPPRTTSLSPDALGADVDGAGAGPPPSGQDGDESTEDGSLQPLGLGRRESVQPLQRAATTALKTTQKTLQMSGTVTPSPPFPARRGRPSAHPRLGFCLLASP